MKLIPDTMPDVPSSGGTAYVLSCEYGWGPLMSPRTSKMARFREVPIFISASLSEDILKELSTSIRSQSTYGGEVMRCFIPRHGLRFEEDGNTLDILICFECYWIYLFTNDTLQRYSLSEKGCNDLVRIFDLLFPSIKGKRSSEILAELPDTQT